MVSPRERENSYIADHLNGILQYTISGRNSPQGYLIVHYYFSLKVLDRMELMPDGKLAVVFLSGTRLTI